MNKPLDSWLERIDRGIEDAVHGGQVSGAPFARFTEDARTVFTGIETVLALLQVDDVKRTGGDEQEIKETLGPDEVYSLMSLARVASKVMAHEAEDLADWADKRMSERGKSHE